MLKVLDIVTNYCNIKMIQCCNYIVVGMPALDILISDYE